MDKERLKGKNIIITGAAQGMGAAVSELITISRS